MTDQPLPIEEPLLIDEPEAPHVHHGKSGVAWLDLALAVSVLGLSGASLLTAQHTGHTMEKLVEENSRLVRANATPVLQFLTGNVGETGRELSLTVSNVGTGTARVIWFELSRGGILQRDAYDLIDYQPDPREQDYVPTRPVAGTYFPAGEERPIMTWKYPNSTISQSKWKSLDTDKYGLKVTACYCSVLGECWTSNLKADAPKPVKQCDAKGRAEYKG